MRRESLLTVKARGSLREIPMKDNLKRATSTDKQASPGLLVNVLSVNLILTAQSVAC